MKSKTLIKLPLLACLLALCTTQFTAASDVLRDQFIASPPSARPWVMAEVTLNGKNLGTLWKAPYRIDVSKAIQPGANELVVKVVNLWVNRQIGDENLPEDSERNADGTLKSWPEWLLKNHASPAGRISFASFRLWKKNEPLVPSGLIGPVRLHQVAMMKVPLDKN